MTNLEEKDWMLEKAVVAERPFTSPTPLIGPLLARFRAAWNSVATKWYVRPLLAQQNEYNRQVALRFMAQDGRLIQQDQLQTDQARLIAELTAQITQLNQRVATLEAQLEESEQ